MRFDVVTLFPRIFESPLKESILKIAQEKGYVEIVVHNLRDFTMDKHRVTDDYPYGGGGGMVMKVEPLVRAVEALRREDTYTILLSPQGSRFDYEIAERFARLSHIILLCGRYEGVDDRIRYFIDDEISIGDYILTGGELAALVIIDAVSRLIPGVLGLEEGARKESFHCGFLEHPHYTRPREFRGLKVPDVLLSGNHMEIERWRRKEALRRTIKKRPDLIEKMKLSIEDLKLIEEIKKEGHNQEE